MKKILGLFFLTILLGSCGNGRSKEEQQQYVDSLFHVISCSPTIVDGPYTLEDQLEACDLLIKEYPKKKDKFEEIKATIQLQIEQRDSENSYSMYDYE